MKEYCDSGKNGRFENCPACRYKIEILQENMKAYYWQAPIICMQCNATLVSDKGSQGYFWVKIEKFPKSYFEFWGGGIKLHLRGYAPWIDVEKWSDWDRKEDFQICLEVDDVHENSESGRTLADVLRAHGIINLDAEAEERKRWARAEAEPKQEEKQNYARQVGILSKKFYISFQAGLALGPDYIEKFSFQTARINVNFFSDQEEIDDLFHELESCGIARRKRAILNLLNPEEGLEEKISEMGQINSMRIAKFLCFYMKKRGIYPRRVY